MDRDRSTPETPARKRPATRLEVEIRGAVQGVGFRPFVYGLAKELGLRGNVRNDAGGLRIGLEGPRSVLEEALARIRADSPPLAEITRLRTVWTDSSGADGFRIEASETTGSKRALVLPDLATCPDCLAEVLDPGDRRYRYPFTNCTRCGPRLSIIHELPYDRARTTMREFSLCGPCRREYEDPGNRRFHAQPVACADCGPALSLRDADGSRLAVGNEALEGAALAIEEGSVIALKGLGGYQLLVDARNEEAVDRLRRRKRRPHKPFALMVADLDSAASLCEIPAAAAAELTSPAAPILLLPRRPDARVAGSVAPDSGDLGVMLPTTPLHHLLLQRLGFPVIATSGNRTGEPLAITDEEALERLGNIADRLLSHDRPIRRRVDDSVGRVIAGQVRLLRRARGYAPLPVAGIRDTPIVLGVGGQLKNTVALTVDGQIICSQHVGDLDSPRGRDALEELIDDLLELYGVAPTVIAHDLHPDYATTRWARRAVEEGDSGRGTGAGGRLAGARMEPVQHHHAHLAACLADNGSTGSALGVTWDGTGYGIDGTVWGGEFLLGEAAEARRVARLRPFRLPGGEQAVREPWRVGLALLQGGGDEPSPGAPRARAGGAVRTREATVVARMIEAGVRSPLTSSVGRLFDGVAALLGLGPRISFEGQAAIRLEAVADPSTGDAYELPLQPPDDDEPGETPMQLDWRPLVASVRRDCDRNVDTAIIAGRFHNTLADAIVAVAEVVGEPVVALTGGCFQNRLLTEAASDRLQRAGFEVLLHRDVPPNDGGLAVGQVAVAVARSGRGDGQGP